MGQNQKHHHHQHHILPTRVAVKMGGILLFMTAVTVWVAHFDLGRFNFIIAMAVATVKASLVALFFMGLKYDRRENAMIFITSFVFLGIFMVLTGTDLFFREEPTPPPIAAAQAPSKLKKPWISTPELVSKGKDLYSIQCVSCHGDGKGDGPAASALNPRPRDFTNPTGWKNGRKPTMVFKTLKEGLPPSAMASFATLPSDDRWALTHYVLSLASAPEADLPSDFAKVGIDPTQEGGGEKVEPTIPIGLAMERMSVPEIYVDKLPPGHPRIETGVGAQSIGQPMGKTLYQAHCLQCHGPQGEGGIRVRNLGVNPVAYAVTQPFFPQSEGVRSQDSFNRWVVGGSPGGLMPGMGQFRGEELKDLYNYVRSLARE